MANENEKPKFTYQNLKGALERVYDPVKKKPRLYWGLPVPTVIGEAIKEKFGQIVEWESLMRLESIQDSGGRYIFDFGVNEEAIGEKPSFLEPIALRVGPTEDGKGTIYIFETTPGGNETESIMRLLRAVKKILPHLPEGTTPYCLYTMVDTHAIGIYGFRFIRVELVYGGDPKKELQKVEELRGKFEERRGRDWIGIVFEGKEELEKVLNNLEKSEIVEMLVNEKLKKVYESHKEEEP